MMKVSKDVLLSIKKHALEEHPNECCGTLFGTDSILKVKKAMNVNKSCTSYTVDSKTLFESVFDKEGFRKDFLGFYHSHIGGGAVPSSVDVYKARYRNKHYLIYSVSNDNFGCFLWDGADFIGVEIER